MRILLVEDDRKAAALLVRGLREEGFVVDHAASLAEADEAAFVTTHDLIVLDGNMPNMDGFEALRQLRIHRATAKIPVIMLTMRSHQVDMLTGYRFGAQEYLTKPIALEQLLVAVKRLLGTR